MVARKDTSAKIRTGRVIAYSELLLVDFSSIRLKMIETFDQMVNSLKQQIQKADSHAMARRPGARILTFAYIVLAAAGFAQSQQDYEGLVVAITDGDTIKVMHDGVAERVRLNGIDCPEKKQPFGTKASQFTGELAFQKVVTVQVKGKDRYGRTIADVLLPDGRILNHEVVKAGFAWWYRKYAPRDEVLAMFGDNYFYPS